MQKASISKGTWVADPNHRSVAFDRMRLLAAPTYLIKNIVH